MKSSAAATQVGAAPFSNTLADTDRWGFDFNPTTDVLTVVNHLDQNFRVSPVDGTLVGADTALDNPGASEELNAIAYDRNFCSSTTTLYGYNYTTDSLVTIGGMNGSPSPTGGVITQLPAAKLNGANFSAGTRIGFDIAGGIGGPDTGYLTMRPQNGGALKRYTIHLATAALSDLGTIGDGTRNFEGAAVRAEGIAPNISTDLKTATWRDLDGDFVTLKITKGALTAANFRMLGGGAQNTTALSKLTLTGEQFTGTNITITAKPSELGGDGKVNIGEITATGVDLGAVKISGDLIAIDAGTAAAPAPSIKSLTVASMGSFGLNLLSGTASTSSTLEDGAGKINIAGDFHGFFNLGNHNTGSITIGGDVIGGTAAGRGGMANLTGNSTLGKLTIKGSIRAEDGSGAAQFLLQGVGSVVVGGDFVGGGADNSAYLGIDGTGKTSITIGGSVVGNTGTASALIAEQIGALTIGETNVPLTAAKNDLTLGFTGDVRVFEL